MKNVISTVVLTLVFFSCSNEEQKPAIVLSESEMVEAITEFQLAEAIIRLGYHRAADSLIANDSIYQAVFDKLEITEFQFDTSYNYYSKRPKEFEHIHTEVITNLSRRDAELKAGSKKESGD